MTCRKWSGSYKSSDGNNTVAYHVWEPDGDVRAVVQISHGMCEYVERYDEFARMMAGIGIAVWGNDHLGHGDTAASEADYGYFGGQDGFKHMVKDMGRLTELIRQSYGETPVVLLAHSMGSFLGRVYLSWYGGGLAAAVIMGTSGSNPLLPLSVPIASIMAAVRGERYRSRWINRIAFGTYNVKMKPKRTDHDWLSRDEKLVDRFEADPRCSFIFTAAGFRDLFSMLKYVSRKEWAEEVPKDLPILLLSGACDPVGRYGKGVRQVHERLLQAGCQVSLKLFEDCRHELLNERNRQNVYEYIVTWVEPFL